MQSYQVLQNCLHLDQGRLIWWWRRGKKKGQRPIYYQHEGCRSFQKRSQKGWRSQRIKRRYRITKPTSSKRVTANCKQTAEMMFQVNYFTCIGLKRNRQGKREIRGNEQPSRVRIKVQHRPQPLNFLEALQMRVVKNRGRPREKSHPKQVEVRLHRVLKQPLQPPKTLF